MQISTHAKSKLLRAAYLGSSAIALGISAPALAQVEEIVVTAQKVEENVQDVPIAITAVSGDTLAASGTNSLENLSQLVPSVTFRKGTTNANSAVVLRGVGTISFSIAAEPSVSTVVDGVVLTVDCGNVLERSAQSLKVSMHVEKAVAHTADEFLPLAPVLLVETAFAVELIVHGP